jgi:type II secretory pathway pseudopilin PulG
MVIFSGFDSVRRVALPAVTTRRSRRRRGSSLLAVVVALAVVAVAALAVASTLVSADRLRRQTAEDRFALLASTTLFDEIRSAAFDDLVATYDGTSRDLQAIVSGAPDGEVVLSVTEAPTGNTKWLVYRIVVEVTVDGVNGSQVHQYATCVTDEAPEGAPL